MDDKTVKEMLEDLTERVIKAQGEMNAEADRYLQKYFQKKKKKHHLKYYRCGGESTGYHNVLHMIHDIETEYGIK